MFLCTFTGVCDDVLETAWSTMWNVTDETPINCRRFLDGGGMKLFLECKEVKSIFTMVRFSKTTQGVIKLPMHIVLMLS